MTTLYWLPLVAPWQRIAAQEIEVPGIRLLSGQFGTEQLEVPRKILVVRSSKQTPGRRRLRQVCHHPCDSVDSYPVKRLISYRLLYSVTDNQIVFDALVSRCHYLSHSIHF